MAERDLAWESRTPDAGKRPIVVSERRFVLLELPAELRLLSLAVHRLPGVSMTFRLMTLSLALLGAASTRPAPAQTPAAAKAPPLRFVVDTNHSYIGFEVSHLGLSSVAGRFRAYQIEMAFDSADVARSTVTVTMQAASLATGNDRRDTDLRDNFFGVTEHPTLTFTSTRVEPVDARHFRIHGNLTIRAISRPVTLDAELLGMITSARGPKIAAFTASTRVKRQDFGMELNRLLEGIQIVGDDVRITIGVEAIWRPS